MDTTRLSPTGRTRWLVLPAAFFLTACPDDGVTPPADNPVTLELEVVQGGFSAPIFVTAPPGDTARLFVVEQGGLIRIIEGGAVLATPFLDVSDSITPGSERGLLGLAFHPDYAGTGFFYVNYTDLGGHTQVKRFTVSGDPDVADEASGLTILSVTQPFSNHNGGMIAFGPDGMLYIGMGDGGDGGDPQNHGQRPSTLLGSMLRLDVDGGSPYAIPGDNPYVAHATYREETWSYGLRNPWRFSFDRTTDDLYIGDVGQGQIEEVDFQPASSDGGENYGWNTMEGSQCYPSTSACSSSGLTLPVAEYSHGEGCSITGGYVYRGSDWPALEGRYFYADYCNGWIRSLVVTGGVAADLQDHTPDVGTLSQISSFGEDGAGELYVVSRSGTVYRITGVETGS
jgi:glucose/arabinose dehydrogenase